MKSTTLQPEGLGFDSRWCHWNFSLTQSFRSHYGPGVDSASNLNEYQVYFLGGRSGWCVGLTTLHLLMPNVMKSGSLNLLEPTGPVIGPNRNCCTFTAQNYKPFINKILENEGTTFLQNAGN